MVVFIIKYILSNGNIFIMKYIHVTGFINYESESGV
jgi:hypothetical protein